MLSRTYKVHGYFITLEVIMIRKRKLKSGYAFQVRLNKKGMAEISKTFTSRKDAERYEREQQIAIDQCALQHKPMNQEPRLLEAFSIYY